MPTLSIAVSSYNQLDLLRQSLASIEAQSVPYDAVFVVDDASSDGSQDFLKDWAASAPNRHFIGLPQNQGVPAVRQHGLNAITTDYVTFLDGDDWLAPDACATVREIMLEAGPDVICFGAAFYHQATGEFRNQMQSSPYISLEPLKCTHPNTEATRCDLFRLAPPTWQKAYRVDFLRENDVRNEGTINEDFLWHHQCIVLADDIRSTPTPLVNYRMHGNSVLGRKSDVHFGIFEVAEGCERFMNACPKATPALHYASRRFRFNIMGNSLLNAGRVPDHRWAEYAQNILTSPSVLDFDMDLREQEWLAQIEQISRTGKPD